MRAFFQEAESMVALSHKHIVKLLGVCTQDTMMLVFEVCFAILKKEWLFLFDIVGAAAA